MIRKQKLLVYMYKPPQKNFLDPTSTPNIARGGPKRLKMTPKK